MVKFSSEKYQRRKENVMDVKGYLNGFEAVTGAKQSLVRLSDAFGDKSQSVLGSTVTDYLRDVKATVPTTVPDGVQTVAGAAAGAILWQNHRFLGAIGGSSIGRNLPALILHPEQRKSALCNMGITGSGVLCSLIAKKAPMVGFAVGWLIGGAAVYFGGLRK